MSIFESKMIIRNSHTINEEKIMNVFESRIQG